MGALPKRRLSTQRQGRRQSQISEKTKNLVKCSHCGSWKMRHQVCSKCGVYK